MEGAYELEEWRNKMRSMTSEFIEVDDLLRETSRSLLPHRKRKKALSTDILESMTKAGVDACNISGRNDRLVVKPRKKKLSLKEVLPSRLEKFFDGDAAKCEECLRCILEPETIEVATLCRVAKKTKSDEGARKEEDAQPAEEVGGDEEEEGSEDED